MSDTVKVIRTSAFRVVMSKGDPISIDEEEVDGVIQGMNKGSVIIVKRGVINPSYIVSIEQDKDRVHAFERECGRTFVESNGKTQGQIARSKGIKPLASIFGETKIGQAIKAKQQERLPKPTIKKITPKKK